MGRKSTEKNPKVRATDDIWGCAVGMLAICIPLVAITESGIILPLLVLLGAGGGTAAIWLAPDKRQQEESDHLTHTIKALEERVMNLETIYVSLPDVEKPLQLSGKDEN